jgi:hypothetical protein
VSKLEPSYSSKRNLSRLRWRRGKPYSHTGQWLIVKCDTGELYLGRCDAEWECIHRPDNARIPFRSITGWLTVAEALAEIGDPDE